MSAGFGIVKRLRFLLLAGVFVFVGGCKTEKVNTEPGNVVANSVGIKLAHIPAGEFEMGSAIDEKGRAEDELRHRVRLTRAFRIGVTEVTQGQWEAVMGYNRSNFKGADLPVEKISWREAVAFCKKLSHNEGKRYRLPTEAEWEYACRAGAMGAFGGTGEIDEMGWYADNSEETSHPVGAKKANAWGLSDMHGNVGEWCSDRYGAEYPEGEVVDPNGPGEGTYRVVRGGSWSHFARACRCAARSSVPESYQLRQTGLRVVMEVSE